MNPFLDELFSYVELGDGDRARLRGLHDVLEPYFPAIADRFYEAIQRSPGASAILASPEQVRRLHATLVDWMSSGLLGPYDDRFYDKRSRIGRRHVSIGLAQHYMFTAMNVVRRAYHERIAALCPAGDATAISRAVDKLLDVELAVMVRHYQLDSEDKLVQRERRIQADRVLAMQTMSAGLAHEVRNPLNAAMLQLELLERRLRRDHGDTKFAEPVALAQKEIERLTALLNDFLAFARPPELHLEECDVVEVVRHVVDLERLAAETRGSTLVLGSGPERIVVETDAPKLLQIVLNLVRNAIEAVGPGGHVEVTVAARSGAVQIAVQDDGPGIPPEVQHRVYEPFFSTKEGGTGLGMSIVHSLVTLHAGTITFATSPRGTRFEVTIPVRGRAA